MDHVVITIARSYGSGGRILGQRLAEELNINCYDKQLLRMASDQSGINEALFGQVDEKIKSMPLFRIAKKIYKDEVFPPERDEYTSDDNLFNYQAKVIKELASEESCIIIGRCADFVLKDTKDVLRMFLYAPQEYCVEQVIDLEGGYRKDIVKKIEMKDVLRAQYYKYHTGNDWYDARNYDLCLNTSTLDYIDLSELVKKYIELKRK